MIDPGAAFGGVTTHNEPLVNRNFPQCAGETVSVTLTVADAAGASDTTERMIQLPVAPSSQRTGAHREADASVHLTSTLHNGAGALGVVRVDGNASFPVRSGRQDHVVALRPGAHVLEAMLAEAPEGEIFWELELGGTPSFVAGSITLEQGNAVGIEPRRIVLRMRGVPGERARLRFETSR